MIRTELKAVSLRSFTEDFSKLTVDVTMEDGQIGTVIVGTDQFVLLVVQLYVSCVHVYDTFDFPSILLMK
ncbi:hypothetical protein ACROYT_G028731 [Oculina patagonica]